MTYVRKFEHTDDNGDTLYAQHVTWTNEEDGPETQTESDDYLQIRTKRGATVYLPMRVAREFAGWLIEHAAEDPDAGWEAAKSHAHVMTVPVGHGVHAHEMTVPVGHGVAMFGGGGAGGVMLAEDCHTYSVRDGYRWQCALPGGHDGEHSYRVNTGHLCDEPYMHRCPTRADHGAGVQCVLAAGHLDEPVTPIARTHISEDGVQFE